MSVKLTDGEWEALIPQVCEIIGDTAETSGKELFEDAKWLIENNVPLTKENIKLISDVKDLIKSYSPDLVLDRIFKGMKEGILPKDAVLIEKDELSINETSQGDNIAAVKSINIKQLLEDIHGITEDDIIRTVNTYDDITIRNLTDSREGDETDVQSVENADKEKQVKFLTAKRQIEEIRLKMTLEAAIRLEKKGFHIETETLERVVERLRTEEENYYKELYSQTVSESDEPDEASLKLLQLTSETVYKLKLMPAYVLGATLNDRKDRTMPDLLAAGQSIKTELDKANEAYEALFTIPRAEYGDSIRKAFSNMYSLMEEMGIENTEYNQRAIRILGYNRMVITHENIEKVKAYDLSVNYLLQNLNPKVAVQIIKLGVNPLDIPIDELNRHIDMLKEQGYSTLDKYSAYLYKLEREEGLSDDERKAYIGIYRLLYQIEKSDGAALGAVIKSNQNITLNHLLTALRTSKKGSVNYKIDDGFGALQEISFSKESITDQLGAVFNNSSKDMTSDTDISLVDSSAQEEIQNVIIKELLNSLTPGKLHQLYIDIQNMAVNSDGKEAADLNVWKTIGNMSLEQLLDNLKNIQTDSDEEHAYYDEKIRMLQEVLNNSDRSIHFLNTFNMPCTAANLMIAGHIINNNTTAFKKLFGLIQDKEEEEKEKSQNGLKKKLELSDTLIDSMTMTKTYEQLEQEVKAVIEEEAVKDNVNLDDLAQLKLMGMHFNFLKNLARREFYQIPIETSGKITNVNLTIIRGKSTSGRVTVSLTSERLGSIKAEASLKGNKLSGYIVSDYAGSLKILENQTAPLISAAQEEGITISQMNFCLMQEADAVYLHQKPWDIEEKNPETERILYKVAKAMIHMIRSAEESVGAVA
jgi:hypothetical protein